MVQIPKIIHQVWEGKGGPMPQPLRVLANTWTHFNPDWEYILWDKQSMENLVEQHFPDFAITYYSFEHDVQRWDAIRYMILYKFGGLYVDLDTECFKPIDALLDNMTCCFGLEPAEHSVYWKEDKIVGNAFMASVPESSFFYNVLSDLKKYQGVNSLLDGVLKSTGPLMVTRVHKEFSERREIDLIASNLVSPLSKSEVGSVLEGLYTQKLIDKMQPAYALHYFLGTWLS